ncbi:MAG: hypothetical protein EYC62_07675 [Alphaproteobacteria bacterium]|nr:MAG: hypothetical protein EYC62_07675 [Alphaproteobacteria bacterium]
MFDFVTSCYRNVAAGFGPRAPVTLPARVEATFASTMNENGTKQEMPDSRAGLPAKRESSKPPATIYPGTFETVELGQPAPKPATYCHIIRTPHARRAVFEAAQNRRVA